MKEPDWNNPVEVDEWRRRKEEEKLLEDLDG